MWSIIASDRFKQDVVHQEISELWSELWTNVLLFIPKEKREIKDFSDKIIELINQIVDNGIKVFQESWDTKSSKILAKQGEEKILEIAKNIFPEMLIKSLLLNEWIHQISAKNKTEIGDEARLLYIKDMLSIYEEKIVWLLTDLATTKTSYF